MEINKVEIVYTDEAGQNYAFVNERFKKLELIGDVVKGDMLEYWWRDMGEANPCDVKWKESTASIGTVVDYAISY